MSFMLNWGLKYITQRVFRENKWNKFGTEDPYHDKYEIEQHSFFGGPTKKLIKVPKSPPEGITENDKMVLKRVRRRAYHLDMLFNVFGYQIGWSGIIGIIPFVGDISTVILSLLLFKSAREVDDGLPIDVQCYMLLNIVVDFVIGIVPVIGTLVEVMYKANSRNALLLENHLKEKGQLNIARSQIGLVSQSPFNNMDNELREQELFKEAARKQHQLDQDELEAKLNGKYETDELRNRLKNRSPLDL